MKWWIYRDGAVSDRPYTQDELEEEDRFNPETWVCRQDTQEWTKAGETEELESLFGSVEKSQGSLRMPDDFDETDFHSFGREDDVTKHDSDEEKQSNNAESDQEKESNDEGKGWQYLAGFILLIIAGAVAAFVVPTDIKPPEQEKKEIGTKAKTSYKVKPIFDNEYKKTVLRLINNAQHKIFVAMYMIKSPELREEIKWDKWYNDPIFDFLQAMVDAKKRGVEVSVILSEINKELNKDKFRSNKSAEKFLENYGIDVQYAESTNLHDKVVIVDKQWILQGAHNWTPVSVSERNREASILLKAKDSKDWTWKDYRQNLLFDRRSRQ